jgi:hypothetical protein
MCLPTTPPRLKTKKNKQFNYLNSVKRNVAGRIYFAVEFILLAVHDTLSLCQLRCCKSVLVHKICGIVEN